MYLILSVAFFLVASLGSDPGSDLHFEVDDKGAANLQLSSEKPAPAPAPKSPGETASPAAKSSPSGGAPPAPATPAPLTPRLDAETARLVESIVKRMPEKDRARARKELTKNLAAVPAAELEPVKRLMNNPCNDTDLGFKVQVFGKSYEPQLREACNKIWSDTPSFGRALFQNVPKMMFIFLPLIAVVMYVLYIGSGRYYVEHLLFVVHYHAFFFLGGLAILLAERTSWLAPGTAIARGGEVAGGILTAAFVIYAPIYLYLAMRRVYGQGRFVTFAKYSMLGIAYLFCMTITAVGLLFYTALSL
jgi:hypothetical protein